MTWRLYQADFQLRSPLHIGERKIGANLQITRRYVPARNLWAALTERLTRCGFEADDLPKGDYAGTGNWVQTHVVLSYLFVAEGDLLRLDWPQASFERRYLSSQLSTAINASNNAAQDESLHEVEFISPRHLDTGMRTHLRGWLLLDEIAHRHFADATLRQWILGDIWLGGERRYGFGHLRLNCWEEANLPQGYAVEVDGDRPIVTVSEGRPALAHVIADDALQVRGNLEVLVGRETTPQGQFGQRFTAAQVCWSPGARVTPPCRFELATNGLWRFTR